MTAEALAKRELASPAEEALAALDDRVSDNAVALCELGDVAPDFCDDADHLVAGNKLAQRLARQDGCKTRTYGIDQGPKVPVVDVLISPTNAWYV